VGDHPHVEAPADAGHQAADGAEADDAQDLFVQGAAHEGPGTPLARTHGCAGGGGVPEQSQHQGEDVLGHCPGVGLRRPGDQHLAPGGLLQIDPIGAHAVAGDDFQLRGGVQDFTVHRIVSGQETLGVLQGFF